MCTYYVSHSNAQQIMRDAFYISILIAYFSVLAMRGGKSVGIIRYKMLLISYNYCYLVSFGVNNVEFFCSLRRLCAANQIVLMF